MKDEDRPFEKKRYRNLSNFALESSREEVVPYHDPRSNTGVRQSSCNAGSNGEKSRGIGSLSLALGQVLYNVRVRACTYEVYVVFWRVAVRLLYVLY
jgi:hypothetical protein